MRESHGAGRSGTSSWATGSPFQDSAERQQEEVSSPGDSELAPEVLALFCCGLAQPLTPARGLPLRCRPRSWHALLVRPSTRGCRRACRVSAPLGVLQLGGRRWPCLTAPCFLVAMSLGDRRGVPSVSCKPSRPVPALAIPVPRLQACLSTGRKLKKHGLVGPWG